MILLHFLSFSVVCVALLHISCCFGTGNRKPEGMSPFLRWKQPGNASAQLVAGGTPPEPKCITPQGSCACQTDQGLIDLSPIDSKDSSKPFFENIQSSDGYTFSYNPCTSFTTNRCSQAAICQCYSSYYCFVIGSHANTKFQNDPSSQKMTITYSTSGFYQSIVTLVCDHSQEGTFVGSSSSSPYKFTLTTKHACPQSGSGGMSVGTILIIVFFCLIAVYLIGGILFMHFAKGAQGVEKIPNATFWMEVPGLVKDGGSYVVRSVKGVRSGYEQV